MNQSCDIEMVVEKGEHYRKDEQPATDEHQIAHLIKCLSCDGRVRQAAERSEEKCQGCAVEKNQFFVEALARAKDLG